MMMIILIIIIRIIITIIMKVKSFLYVIKYNAKKTHKGVVIQAREFHSFVNWTLGITEWSSSRSSRFNPAE
jgi:hypothetical protein